MRTKSNKSDLFGAKLLGVPLVALVSGNQMESKIAAASTFSDCSKYLKTPFDENT